jgi:hypothetical protein
MDEERYDFLASATADLSNATAEVDFDPNPGEEPGNPTGRLNTSNGRSSVKPAKVLMPRSSRTTKSISSVT